VYGKDFDFLEEKEKLSKKDFPSKLLCSYMDFVHIFFPTICHAFLSFTIFLNIKKSTRLVQKRILAIKLHPSTSPVFV
jgi:hypothetical protein